jgi:hypothetical protein
MSLQLALLTLASGLYSKSYFINPNGSGRMRHFRPLGSVHIL